MKDINQRLANLSPAKRALLEQQLQKKALKNKPENIVSRRINFPEAPLSFSQEPMWLLDQLEPGNPAYNRPTNISLIGKLNVAVLEQSLNEIIRRHEILRTSFEHVNGKPFQKINPNITLKLPIVELSHLNDENKEIEVQKLAIEEAQQTFDLTQAPLLKAKLVRLHEQKHILLLTMHHIVFDGWSMGVLLKELGELYQAFLTGKPSPLPELAIQYADFAVWQRQQQQTEKLESQLSYWKNQLGGKLPVLELPTDRARAAVQTFRGAKHSLLLPNHLIASLKALSLKENVTLFMTLLAAFQILLYRYTSEEDIIVGTPIANRDRVETEKLIGVFINTLVLRNKLNSNLTFTELLAQVRQAALGAYSHQDVPFEKLVEELKPERNLSHHPLFQILFQLRNLPEETIEVQDLKFDSYHLETGTSLLDLALEIEEQVEGFLCVFKYNTDIFDASTIERMAVHFQTLLEGIIEHPQQEISQLPLLSKSEKHQLLIEWNNTATDYPRDKCIHQLFEEQVEKTPDAIAITFNNQQITYNQLNLRANQLAHYLRSIGVNPEDKIGISLERSIEIVVGVLAILKAGGAYVPLDPSYPKERIEYMLKDSGVSILITKSKFVEKLSAINAKVIALDKEEQIIASQAQVNPVNQTNYHHLAYIIYTSGSSGKSKGVAVTHLGINRLVNNTNYIKLQPSDKVAQSSNTSFDAATFEIWGALLHGAELVGVPREIALSPEKFVAHLQQHQISVAFLTTALFNQFATLIPTAFKSLRYLLFGGEAVDPNSVKKILQHGKPEKLLHVYGPTENTTFSSWYLVEEVPQKVTIIPIGTPIANTQIYILDNHLQPVPIGIPGELYIGGDGLASCYLNRLQLTKEKFIPNPFSNSISERLYKTGDLARYLPDGNITFIGRIDNQVKIRGFRIELGEIESVLNTHPQVNQAVVIVREDIPGHKSLVAYVVTSDESLTTKQLREFIKSKLPEYMVPSSVVILDTLPLTPNGKVDKKALPVPDFISRENEYAAPRSQSEEILTNIFASILRVQNIGIFDNFFELGGNSLLATQLISRMREAFSLEIPLRTLFESPTVAQLDQTLIQLGNSNQLSLPPIQPRSSYEQLPLSWAQERLWFLNQLEGLSATYNISRAFHISGNLNVDALQKALSEIVNRHQVLRTSFQTVNGKAIQVIDSETTININVVDLVQLPPTESENVLNQQIQQEAITPFDLEIAPLIKCILYKLKTNEYVLLLTMHHIVSDGWSIGILIQELSSLYKAFTNKEPSPLPELPIQYADFAVWQRKYLSGEILETQLNYWKQQLHNAPQLLQLPTDRPRPTVQTYRGSTQSFTLNTDLTEKLQILSRDSGTTLFMTLYAAFVTLLYRYSGQSDIVVGSPIANRNYSEIEPLIGFFVNTLVLRTHFEDNPSFKELLAQVRETTLKAYEHQYLPFEKLVQALHPQRSLSHSPLFQVMFVLQNASLSELELPGITWSRLNQDTTIAKFDLTVSITETERELVCNWQYNTDLFNKSTIERMAGHFENLLSAIVENPSQKVSELCLLSESQRHQLLVEWNDTATDYPRDICIHQLFEEQVEKTPDAIAVVFEDEQLTYQQLNQKANQLAHHLQTLGVKPEVLVGICVERSIEMLVGLLGILKAGGAYVPLDPNYPAERLSYMLADSGVEVLLTQNSLLASLPLKQARVVCLDTDWQEIEQHNSQENLNSEVIPDNLAYVIYTSGSTGQPKGVAVTHLGINRLVNNTNYIKLQPSDKVAQSSNTSFDAATFEIWVALLNGAQLVGVPQEITLSPEKFVTHLQQYQISVAFLTTALFNQFATLIPTAFKSLRYLLFGGEAVDPNSVKKILQHGKPKKLLHVYGPTENTTFSSWYLVEDIPEEATTIPIGIPIANTQIYILDNHLQPVPIGIPGEIYIGGAGLARCYLNRPEITQQKFIPNPFSKEPGARLYKTGDLARYLKDGNIEYISRIDNQVKIRGFRIELGEIEATLAQHGDIREVIVIPREIIPGDKRLVAYIVSEEHTDILTTKLRDFIKQKLPQYMHPNAFVVLDALPLTPNGKVDRKALPAPDTTKPQAETFVPPRNSLEQQLVKIWEQVLGIQPIGVTDNFFELGGHSLLTVRLVAQIEKVTQKKLPLAALFQFTTISEIASAIAQNQVAKKIQSNLSPELPTLDEDDLRALLTFVAGRTKQRIRPDSLMNPIRSQGEKPPLFYCANGINEVSTVARYLDKNQPVYLLESGLAVFREKGKWTQDDIKGIAARHVRDMLDIYPDGPYLLVGYSFGKNVTYEVAKQLIERGKKVVLLAILDTSGSGWMYRYYVKKLQPALMGMKKQLLHGSLLNVASNLGSLLYSLKDDLTAYKYSQPLETNQAEYLMQGYSGKITLFVTPAVRRYAKIQRWLFPSMGWGEHVVDIIATPGDHYNMIQEPYARMLADKLNACIDRALELSVNS